MALYVLRQQFRRYIVLVAAKGVFNFLGYELEAGEYIKDKGHYGDDIKPELEDIAKGQRHDIEENEFFDEYAVGKRDGGVLDPLAGAADIGEGLQFGIEEQ